MKNTEYGLNRDLHYQLDIFCEIISKNKYVYEVCDKARYLNLKNYYIGAGCIAQTVWNHLSDFPLSHGINDIDIVYFDEDLSYERENELINKSKELFKDIPLKIDMKNQARVHLWYKAHFGYDIDPYSSVEEAINTWPTTSTAIGVRLNKDNSWIVYAPFGLNDVLGKVVRANKAQITKEIYEKKIERWITFWPDLKVIPWEK